MRILVDSQETLNMLTRVCDAARQKDWPSDMLRGFNVAKMAIVIGEASTIELPKKESPEGEN